MSQDKDNLDALGGVLIVLSLMLLYCWYTKQRSVSSEYFSKRPLGGYEHGEMRWTDGFNPHFINTHLPDMKFRDKGLSEQESYLVNRHPLRQDQQSNDVAQLRWAVDGMIGNQYESDEVHVSGYPDFGDNSNSSQNMRAREILGWETRTPLKTQLPHESQCASVSQILGVDHSQ